MLDYADQALCETNSQGARSSLAGNPETFCQCPFFYGRHPPPRDGRYAEACPLPSPSPAPIPAAARVSRPISKRSTSSASTEKQSSLCLPCRTRWASNESKFCPPISSRGNCRLCSKISRPPPSKPEHSVRRKSFG